MLEARRRSRGPSPLFSPTVPRPFDLHLVADRVHRKLGTHGALFRLRLFEVSENFTPASIVLRRSCKTKTARLRRNRGPFSSRVCPLRRCRFPATEPEPRSSRGARRMQRVKLGTLRVSAMSDPELNCRRRCVTRMTMPRTLGNVGHRQKGQRGR